MLAFRYQDALGATPGISVRGARARRVSPRDSEPGPPWPVGSPGSGSPVGSCLRLSSIRASQRQRVNIVRALINDPAVLLVAEPISALDHEWGAAVLNLITDRTQQNASATVLVTHDPSPLSGVDQVVEVRDGHLRAATRTAA